MNKKWIGVIILGVIGVIAAFIAIEWLTQPIHSLPSFLGGHPHKHGHYTRRGDAVAVVAVLALGGAAYLAYSIRKSEKSESAAGSEQAVAPPPRPAQTSQPASSANSLLGSQAAAPEPEASPPS